jgi:YggT family protein
LSADTDVIVINTIVQIATGLIWLETLLIVVSVLLTWLPMISPWHPAVRLLHALVDPVLRPFRRVLPPIAGMDFSPLLAILVLRAVSALLTSLTAGAPASVLAALVGVVAQFVLSVILILALLVGVRLVLSFFRPSPWNPAVRVIDRLTDPLVRPFTRLARRTVNSVSLTTATALALVGYFALYVVASFAFASLQRLVA